MTISGTYEGYYEYGAGYVLPEFGERVIIRVIIKETYGKVEGD